MEKEYFDSINKTRMNVVSEYVYYQQVKNISNLADFSKYKEINDNGEEVISIHNVHKCLLEECEDYKDFVIDEVLYDIDKYGYYADNDFEYALSEVCGILESDITPDDIGYDIWNSLGYINEKQHEKQKDKQYKSSRNRKIKRDL